MALSRMNRKAKIGKWMTFLIFVAAIVLLVLLSKNKGSFADTFSEITSWFGK